jgi:hypothetical protein
MQYLCLVFGRLWDKQICHKPENKVTMRFLLAIDHRFITKRRIAVGTRALKDAAVFKFMLETQDSPVIGHGIPPFWRNSQGYFLELLVRV